MRENVTESRRNEISNQNVSNVNIYAVDILGARGNSIRPKTIERMKHILLGISEYTSTPMESIGMITHKYLKEELGGVLHYGENLQGDNRYAGMETIALLGRPNPNILAVNKEYMEVTGCNGREQTDSARYQEYYESKLREAILQGLRCNRANLCTGKQFRVFFVWTGVVDDIDFLRSDGYDIQVIDSSVFLADFLENNHPRLRIVNALTDLMQDTEKVTQATTSEYLGVSEETLRCAVKKRRSNLSWMQLKYFIKTYLSKQDESSLERIVNWTNQHEPISPPIPSTVCFSRVQRGSTNILEGRLQYR